MIIPRRKSADPTQRVGVGPSWEEKYSGQVTFVVKRRVFTELKKLFVTPSATAVFVFIVSWDSEVIQKMCFNELPVAIANKINLVMGKSLAGDGFLTRRETGIGDP